mmetsp:Transcript_64/g.111  ORF Transcript_64/g.111 Transcript_64/m.111 type:complete len:440 (+) Transcript_64:452-1771(+)
MKESFSKHLIKTEGYNDRTPTPNIRKLLTTSQEHYQSSMLSIKNTVLTTSKNWNLKLKQQGKKDQIKDHFQSQYMMTIQTNELKNIIANDKTINETRDEEPTFVQEPLLSKNFDPPTPTIVLDPFTTINDFKEENISNTYMPIPEIDLQGVQQSPLNMNDIEQSKPFSASPMDDGGMVDEMPIPTDEGSSQQSQQSAEDMLANFSVLTAKKLPPFSLDGPLDKEPFIRTFPLSTVDTTASLSTSSSSSSLISNSNLSQKRPVVDGPPILSSFNCSSNSIRVGEAYQATWLPKPNRQDDCQDTISCVFDPSRLPTETLITYENKCRLANNGSIPVNAYDVLVAHDYNIDAAYQSLTMPVDSHKFRHPPTDEMSPEQMKLFQLVLSHYKKEGLSPNFQWIRSSFAALSSLSVTSLIRHYFEYGRGVLYIDSDDEYNPDDDY